MSEQRWLITHENGTMVVFAESEKEAVDAFYDSIKSIIGHRLKICGCFGPEKELDRSQHVQVLKAEPMGSELPTDPRP